MANLEKMKDNVKSLTGPERAAVLLLSLGEEFSAKIFERMDDDEIRDISQQMAMLGNVSATVVEDLFIEFTDQISSTGSLSGTLSSTERLLRKVLDEEKVNAIMEEIRGPAGRTMWDKLGNVNETLLANYLKNEYPQTVAVVLTKVRSEHAAKVLNALPESFAMEVILRMLCMDSVQREVLDDVEKTLKTEFMSNLARTSKRDANEMMADIFNNLDRSTEARFIENLEERNPNAAEAIRALMFTFEDLGKLDPGSVQTVLKVVDKQRLALALKGAPDTIKDLFFGSMSERAAKIMKDDMAGMGMVRLRDVEEAQMEIVKRAKELADRGEIQIVDKKDEDELIY